MLGYRGNESWRDMSDYLVHFTGTSDALRSILMDGEIKALKRFGWVYNHEPPIDGQASACLSEVPMEYLERLVDSRKSWGIAFTKSFVLSKGGGRVWYLDRGSPHASALFTEVGKVAYPLKVPSSPLLSLTPFIDLVQPAGVDQPRHEFEWEREWRVPGGLSFSSSDVAFLFAPAKKHAALRSSRYHACSDNAVVIDPQWPDNLLRVALSSL